MSGEWNQIAKRYLCEDDKIAISVSCMNLHTGMGYPNICLEILSPVWKVENEILISHALAQAQAQARTRHKCKPQAMENERRSYHIVGLEEIIFCLMKRATME